jgi:hypothetical protein
MRKNINPVTAVIAVVIVVLLIVAVWWRLEPHQKLNAGGIPPMSAAQKQGFEAMQKLAPGAGGVPGGAGPTGPAGMRAMQQLYPGAHTGGAGR